jgi:DNA-binding transcriptional LysR family regulator
MEWDDLKHFLAVARSGSLTDAARSLKTSAATVGRRITALEGKLGARLFERKQSGYTLTDSGEAIRLKAEEAEEAILSVERAALGRDSRATGKVCVSATDDIGTYVIAPRLAEFRRRHSGISLEIVARMDLVNLSRREADIAVRGMRPAEGDFVIRRAGSWHFGLYAAKAYVEAHDLKPGLKSGPRDLSNTDIITWTEEWAHLRGGPWFAEHARGARVALASDSRRIHQAACKAGIGLAILPCAVADRDPDLVCLLPPERVLSIELWLVVHRDLTRTARVRAVMDFLADAVASSGQ